MAHVQLEQCSVDLAQRSFTGPHGSGILTETEARLLAYLVERPSRDISRDELLVEVWGLPVTSLSRCVDTAMRRLRTKLEAVPRRPRHLLTRHGSGYRFEPLGQPSVAERAAGLTLFGRARELAAVAEALRRGRRSITLHGPAGIGKTAMARALLRLEGPAVPPRLGFASLGAATGLEGVITTISEAASAPVRDATAAGLAASLGSKGPGILVLDTAEHVLGPVREVVDAALSACPELVILVTSRRRLGIEAESVFEIGPLGPEDAAALFRARALTHGADDVDGVHVRRIAHRLDGIPLALELAAARTRIMSCAGVADRLEEADRSWLGTRGPVDDERHRTLAVALGWSWRLLDESRRWALARLAASPASLSFSAAEALLAPAEALDTIQDLLDASWLVREGSRLRLLDAVAAFVRDAEPEIVASARAPFRRWCLALCDARAEVRLGEAGAEARTTIGAELDGLLAAHADAIAAGDAEAAIGIASGLDRVLRQQGPYDLHRRILEASHELRGDVDDARRSSICRRYGDLLRMLARDGSAALAETVDAARTSGDPATLARALVVRAVDRESAALSEAVALYREALEISTRIGLDDWAATALTNLAALHLRAGDPDSAIEVARQARALFARSGTAENVANADEMLGAILCQCGRVAEGLPRLREAVEVLGRTGQTKRELTASLQLGAAALDAGALDEAEAAWQRTIALADRLGLPRLGLVARGSLGIVAWHRGDVDGAEAILARAQLEARDQLGHDDVTVLAWRTAALVAGGRSAEAREVAGLASDAAARSQRPDELVLAALAGAFADPEKREAALEAARPWQDRSTAVRVLARALHSDEA